MPCNLSVHDLAIAFVRALEKGEKQLNKTLSIIFIQVDFYFVVQYLPWKLSFGVPAATALPYCNTNVVEGDKGREPGRIRAGGGWEAGGGGTGGGSHARTGGRRRMKDIKFFNDFLVCY